MPINLGLSHVAWCIRLFHGTDPLNFHSCVTTNLQVRSYSNSRKTVQIKSLQLIHTLTEPPNPSWLHTDSNHQCIELSCAPPTVMWPLFLPKQYRNSLHLPSPWQESHAYYLFCPIFLPLSLSVPPPHHHHLLTPKYHLFFCHCVSFLDCWSGPTVNISSIALQFLNRFTASQGESRIPISDSHAEPFRQILFLPGLHPLLGPNNLPYNPLFPHTAPFLFFLQNLQIERNLCLLT